MHWSLTWFLPQGMMFGWSIGVYHVTYLRWYKGTTHWTIVQPMTIQPLSTKWLRSLNRYVLPYQKKGSPDAHWKIWKELLRGAKILFCGRGLKCLSPLRGTNSKTTRHLLTFFRLNTLKGIAKIPAVDLLRLNNLKCTRTTFLTPKRWAQTSS